MVWALCARDEPARYMCGRKILSRLIIFGDLNLDNLILLFSVSLSGCPKMPAAFGERVDYTCYLQDKQIPIGEPRFICWKVIVQKG